MIIYIQTLTGVKHTFDFEESNTIQSLKDKIFEQEHIPIHQQRLIFKNAELDVTKTFADYGLSDGSSIYLVVRKGESFFEQSQFKEYKEFYVNQFLKVVEMIQFFIMTEGENSLVMKMPNNTTIKQVKDELKKTTFKYSKNADIILFWNAKGLKDKETLAFYNINNDSTIQSTLAFRGRNLKHAFKLAAIF